MKSDYAKTHEGKISTIFLSKLKDRQRFPSPSNFIFKCHKRIVRIYIKESIYLVQ